MGALPVPRPAVKRRLRAPRKVLELRGRGDPPSQRGDRGWAGWSGTCVPAAGARAVAAAAGARAFAAADCACAVAAAGCACAVAAAGCAGTVAVAAAAAAAAYGWRLPPRGALGCLWGPL